MSLAMVARESAFVRAEACGDGMALIVADYFGRWSRQSHQVEAFSIEATVSYNGRPSVPVDQFQIFTGFDEARGGSDAFGPPLFLQYADAYTECPLPPPLDRVLRIFVFRAEADPIAGLVAVEHAQGVREGGRNYLIDAGVLRSIRVMGHAGVRIHRLIPTEPDGLGAELMVAESGVSMEIPGSFGTNGLFLFVSRGTIFCDGVEYGIETLGWMSPGEGRQHVRAGTSGAECLVMRFPFPPTRSVRLAS